MATIPWHPLAGIFPLLEGEEYDSFKHDIQAQGLLDPVVLLDGMILDGRNRARACADLGIELKSVPYEGDSDPEALVAFVRSKNQFRRHLSQGQLAMSVVLEDKLLTQLEAQARERQREAGKQGAEHGQKGAKHGQKGGRPRKNPPSGHVSRRGVSDQEVPATGQVEEEFAGDREEVVEEASEPDQQPDPSLPPPGKKERSYHQEEKGRSREKAAEKVGVSGRQVGRAAKVADKDPELAQKVLAGKVSLPQAVREVERAEKRETLAAKAEQASAQPVEQSWRIVTGDCLEELRKMDAGSVRLVFADPPYNQGIDYGEGAGADQRPLFEYYQWCANWFAECFRVLAEDGSIWVLCPNEHAAVFELLLEARWLLQGRDEAIGELLDALPGTALAALSGMGRFSVRGRITWYESFGVNCANNFGRCSRRILYAVKDPKRFVFHREAVTRASDRAVKYNDPRADPDGKVWEDVWGINPPIPRLVGNAKERLPDVPTQLPLDLLLPVVGCASDPGDLVLDPFNGSGTTGAAALRLGRRYHGLERSKQFADLARQRLLVEQGQSE